MKLTVVESREYMRKLKGNFQAEFDWNASSLNGEWLTVEVKSVYADHVEEILGKISEDWAYEVVGDKTYYELFDFQKSVITELAKPKTIKVRQWLTKKADNPVPMRTMKCTILKETQKAIQVKLQGFIAPSTTCLHCNRTLTHPVSLLYGIGPVCGGHFHINPLSNEQELKERYEEMKNQMASVVWEGWLPKSQVTIED